MPYKNPNDRKKWIQNNRTHINEYARNWHKDHLARAHKTDEKSRIKVRTDVLLHYTRVFDSEATTPHCNHCPFSDIRALSLDFIIGGHRASGWPTGGLRLYVLLKKKGYPEGWQVLCMNCQFIKKKVNKEQSHRVSE
jgi:hypothetical protein